MAWKSVSMKEVETAYLTTFCTLEAIFDGRGKREEGWGVRPEIPDGVAMGLGLFERGVTRERFNKEGAFGETLEFSSDLTLNLLA